MIAKVRRGAKPKFSLASFRTLLHSREIETLHFFNGKVLDGDNEPSRFQAMHMNSAKQSFEVIANFNETNTYTDNVSMSLC